MQLRGTCAYGKLNYYLGKRAANDKRPSIYPDIDFCKNPSSICNDSKRAPELRWLTGMFYWAHTVQRNGNFDYLGTLRKYVDGGNYTEDSSFIGLVNTLLGGSPDDISNRTATFYSALEIFELIEPEYVEDANVTNTTNATAILNYCGVDFSDADSKCSTPCTVGPVSGCPGGELCFENVTSCAEVSSGNQTDASNATPPANGTATPPANGTETNSTDTVNVTDTVSVNESNPIDNAIIDTDAADAPIALSATISTNYCGTSWGDAFATCGIQCIGGFDNECPPGQK